jgi:ATP-dependent Clp protease ATP-binding subunit ClpC
MNDDAQAASPSLTKRTQAALRYAQEEQTTLQLPNLAAACLLLGLLREEHNVAARVLRDCPGFPSSLEQLRHSARLLATPTMAGLRSDAGLTFDQVLAQSVQVAATIAEQLAHHYIGTEHVLLGLLSSQRNSATDLLAEVGVSADAVRQSLVAVLRPNTS